MASSIAHTPAKIGIEVRGVDLKSEQSKDIIEKIKSDVHKHRLVIFKDQGQISGARHVQISEWFGDIESTFYKHPKSPHPDVFRVSNDEREGCRNVGRTGWHIDGSFMMEPFNYAIYHMVSIPKTGATAFIGFEELLNSLSPERRASWERLWMVGNSRDVVHPLIYSHPVTRKPVLCFHLGMIGCFIWNYGSKHQRVTDRKETIKILQEIHGEIVKEDEKLVYKHNMPSNSTQLRHKWKAEEPEKYAAHLEKERLRFKVRQDAKKAKWETEPHTRAMMAEKEKEREQRRIRMKKMA